MQILIIEDDQRAASYLCKGLKESGHLVELASDGKEGLEMAFLPHFDILIIDRMLPTIDGLTIIQKIREKNVDTPVLILSALASVNDRVKGLRRGGDDYLVKPYSFEELLARVEVLSRRKNTTETSHVLTLADLSLNQLNRKVSRANQDLELLPLEFRLLEYMMKNSNRVLTRTMLLENVWDYNFDPQTNVIDVHVSRLRNKIDKGFDFPLLKTIRGSGYMLSES